MHRASTLESTAPANRDPLASRFASKRIGKAQYLAAQQFRKLWGGA